MYSFFVANASVDRSIHSIELEHIKSALPLYKDKYY
jgi:hypothetical protein